MYILLYAIQGILELNAIPKRNDNIDLNCPKKIEKKSFFWKL